MNYVLLKSATFLDYVLTFDSSPFKQSIITLLTNYHI